VVKWSHQSASPMRVYNNVYTTTSGRSRANGICLSDVRKRYSLLMKRAYYYYCTIERWYTFPKPRFYVVCAFANVIRGGPVCVSKAYRTGNALAWRVPFRIVTLFSDIRSNRYHHTTRVYMNVWFLRWCENNICLYTHRSKHTAHLTYMATHILR